MGIIRVAGKRPAIFCQANRIMPSREILQLGNPLLWEISRQVEDFSSRWIESIIADLSDTLAAFRSQSGFGRGIAAPQIGLLERVLFIRMQPTGFCGPIINPEILWASDEMMELWDDCFSLPDLMIRVRRNRAIRVSYCDERGARHSIEAEGDLSELLQHEIDHLDGILATERAISPHAISTRAEWEKRLKKISA
ncbi:MAG: peptide deformylase [Acidobacteriota bacterium]